MSKQFTAEQSYYFKAPQRKVFAALTEPDGLTKWFLSKAKVVPSAGGSYEFDWIGGYHMIGKIKKFEADKAVSFSWHDKIPSGELVETEAAFSLEKSGSGTILKLQHSGFKDPEHFAECSSRWAYYLTNMKSVLDWGNDLRSEKDW
jgi:uncharacterized protein YndB with AHSA1/START domain